MIQSKVTIRGSQRFTSDETNSTLVIAVTHESLPSWVKAILCKPAFPLVSQKNQTDPPNIEINWSCDKSMRLHGLTPTKMTWCVQKKTNKEIYWQILCVSVFWTVCVCVCIHICVCVSAPGAGAAAGVCVSCQSVSDSARPRYKGPWNKPASHHAPPPVAILCSSSSSSFFSSSLFFLSVSSSLHPKFVILSIFASDLLFC